MVYTSLAEAEKAVNAVQAQVVSVKQDVAVVSDSVKALTEKVTAIGQDGHKPILERVEALEGLHMVKVEVKPCLALEDVQSIVAETVEVWRLLEQACSRLVGKGLLFERKDYPEGGTYSVKFYRVAQ